MKGCVAGVYTHGESRASTQFGNSIRSSPDRYGATVDVGLAPSCLAPSMRWSGRGSTGGTESRPPGAGQNLSCCFDLHEINELG